MSTEPKSVSDILKDLSDGDATAAGELLPLVYDQLRSLASRHFVGQGNHTLQPTALVHEAFLRLAHRKDLQWTGRAHIIAVASRAMRQVLMNHARNRNAAKRGGGWNKVMLNEGMRIVGERQIDFIALDEAMSKLGRVSPRQCRVIELRFFGGLSIEETAHVLDVGTTTVEDDWYMAKAWLARELREGVTTSPEEAPSSDQEQTTATETENLPNVEPDSPDAVALGESGGESNS